MLQFNKMGSDQMQEFSYMIRVAFYLLKREREQETERPRGKSGNEVSIPWCSCLPLLQFGEDPVARRLPSIRRLKYPTVFLLLESGCIHHLQHFEIAWLVFACLLSNMSASNWHSFWWVFSIKNSNAVLHEVTGYFHDFAFLLFSVVCILLWWCLSWDIVCILLPSGRLQMLNIVRLSIQEQTGQHNHFTLSVLWTLHLMLFID